MSRSMMILALAAGLSAAPLAASAQAVIAKDEPVAAATTGDPNRKICKTGTTTGTRLARARICKTAREWAEKQHEHKRQLEQFQNRPNLPDDTG